MFCKPDTVSTQQTSYNTAASGGASTVTLNAVAKNYHVIDWITWSYAAAPSSGALTVTDATNNTTLQSVDITVAGPGGLFFGERGLAAPVGAAVTVTLADGSATKKLTVQYR